MIHTLRQDEIDQLLETIFNEHGQELEEFIKKEQEKKDKYIH